MDFSLKVCPGKGILKMIADSESYSLWILTVI